MNNRAGCGQLFLRGDIMTDISTGKLSRQLNKGTYLRSMSIVLFAALCCSVFSAVPYFILKLTDISHIRSFLNVKGINIFPYIAATIFLLLTLLMFIILSTVSVGEKAWYTGRLTQKKQCGKRLRFWFRPSRSIKAFGLCTAVFMLKLLWTLAFLSPSMLVLTSAALIALNGGIELWLAVSLSAGGVLLLVTGLIFRFIIVQRYFLAPYLIADNPKLGIADAVKQSAKLSEGQISPIVKLKLRFLPAFFTYPLIFPAIFLHPHYKQSCSIIAKSFYL